MMMKIIILKMQAFALALSFLFPLSLAIVFFVVAHIFFYCVFFSSNLLLTYII